MRTPLRITIFDDSGGEHCSQCGESLELVLEHIRGRYGVGVEVEYLDLAQPEASLQHQGLVHRIRKGELMLPLVAIDGVLRLSGRVEYRTIVEAIETLKEVGCA